MYIDTKMYTQYATLVFYIIWSLTKDLKNTICKYG